MQKPKISVIIPVYNAEKYLKRCLDSVINQTFKDIEIILVDDGSKDQSGRICDELQVIDKRIKVIHQSNSGPGFARNNALKMATGEYISFVDSDDYIESDMYEKIYKAIKNEDADTCIFGYHKVRDGKIFYTRTNAISGTFKGREALTHIFLNVLGTEPSYPDDYRILWQSSCLSLYSLDLIQKHNVAFPSEGELAKFGEDFLFDLDYFIHASNVTIVNEPFYYYCESPNSINTSFKECWFLTIVNLYRELRHRVRNYLKDEDFLEKAEERLRRTFLAGARNCIMHISAFFSYKDGRGHIMDICNNPVIREVLQVYPWKKNPFKYRLFNYCLDKKRIWLLYLLGKLKK